MSRINLDIDILRTLVIAQQLGGFNRAAQRVGRSQSAVSQQIRKLEEQVGKQLFRKEEPQPRADRSRRCRAILCPPHSRFE